MGTHHGAAAPDVSAAPDASAARVPPLSAHDAGDWVQAHEALSRLSRQRAALDAEEGRWLLCAWRSAAHVHLGYGSFAQYVESLFGYKPRTIQEKLRVADSSGDERTPTPTPTPQKRRSDHVHVGTDARPLPRAKQASRRRCVAPCSRETNAAAAPRVAP